MWPKFSGKQEKPPLHLSLEPLTIFEDGSTSVRRTKKYTKTIICLKLLAAFLSGFIFCFCLYYLMMHMAYCAKWYTTLEDDRYANFYKIYVSPVAGDGEMDNSFYRNIFIEIYDGEYDVPDNLDEYKERFKIFLKKYNKSYTQVEENYRLRVYTHNVLQYEKEESKTPWIDYDETQFTDWTDTELKKILISSDDLPKFEETPQIEESTFGEQISRPLQVDWRTKGKVTQIKNQQQCGSCWAFAVVAAVESQQAIKKNATVLLSEQQLVDCDSRNKGCHGGYRPYAMDYIRKNGLYSENSYPYLATEHNQCKTLNETKVYINDYKLLSQNEETQADWVAQNGPVTFGMKVIKQMYSYRNGIYEPSAEDCEEHSLGSHAMTIVGYGSERGENYWIVKNSWGSYWGQSGYFKLIRGVNACGAAESVVAPIIN